MSKGSWNHLTILLIHKHTCVCLHTNSLTSKLTHKHPHTNIHMDMSTHAHVHLCSSVLDTQGAGQSLHVNILFHGNEQFLVLADPWVFAVSYRRVLVGKDWDCRGFC